MGGNHRVPDRVYGPYYYKGKGLALVLVNLSSLLVIDAHVHKVGTPPELLSLPPTLHYCFPPREKGPPTTIIPTQPPYYSKVIPLPLHELSIIIGPISNMEIPP